MVGCRVQTQIKAWQNWPGTVIVANPTQQFEAATFDVYVPGTDPDQACQAGQQLAAAAFPKLPPAQIK
jgi:hypothetical protein